MRAWFVLSEVPPGTVLATWQRPFDLCGFSGSHRVLLFRSPREDWSGPDGHRDTRIDLVFKPIDTLHVRASYRTLTLRTATAARNRQLLPEASTDELRIVELVDADGSVDHIACLATGWHEDRGDGGEPSPFAEDLSAGRTPSWRTRVLGGGPDGDLGARYASVAALEAALNAAAGSAPTGRFLYLSMMRFSYPAPDDPDPRVSAVAAFLTRAEAEAHRAAQSTGDATDPYRIDRWVDVVPLDL